MIKPRIMSRIISGLPVTVEYVTTWCTWELTSTSSGKPCLAFVSKPGESSEDTEDGEEILKEFLGIRSEQDALAFLQKTGCFEVPQDAITVEGQPTVKRTIQACIGDLQDVLEWRDILKELLMKPPAKWGWLNIGEESFDLNCSGDGIKTVFGGLLDKFDYLKSKAIIRKRRFDIEFRWSTPEERHAAVMKTRDALGAMLGTIYVNHLHGSKFGFCARCGDPFKKESEHRRKYCGYDCAHADAEFHRRKREKTKQRKNRLQK